MKRKLVDRCKFAGVFAIMALGLWSCKDDPNLTGYDILPGSDLTKVRQITEVESNRAYTRNDTILRTDGLLYNVLGTFNDPVFGKTTADFACQFRMAEFPAYDEEEQVDSLVLSFLYKEMFGDTVTVQTLKVYELAEDIYADTTGSAGTGDVKYYQDVDLKALASNEVIGQLDFLPTFRLDSTETDTLIQELRIPLSSDIADKLFQVDQLDAVNYNEAFVDYFKGVYVEIGDVSDGGGLVNISTLAYGSKMTLYTSHHEMINNVDSLIVDSLDFRINDNCARISRFVHDYSQTEFAANLNSNLEQDSLIYLQTMGGLRSKLELPALDLWPDSADANIGINKAELVLQVDTVASDYPNYRVPDRILMTAIDDQNREYWPADFLISPIIYGGYFDDEDNSYRFNITRHLQNLVNQETDSEGTPISNNGFYLSTYNKENQPARVVLKGATSAVGIRLEITYIKYN